MHKFITPASFFQKYSVTIISTLLENIDRLKERDGITSDYQLARACGVSQPTFSRLRTGKIDSIKFDALEKIARYFHTDPARLFTKEFIPPSKQFETHMMVAERLSESELEPLTQTGLAFLKQRQKAA